MANNKLPVKLYMHWLSPPSRVVILVCKVLGINNEKHLVDLMRGEHMKPAFLQINPDHCVPTIIDDGFTLWESRAIAAYLVDKYAPDNALWPKDLQKRAHVHRMMDFDNAVYKAIGAYAYPKAGFMPGEPDLETMEKMLQRLNDTVFNDKPYACGDHMTLADLFMVATVTFPELVGYSVSEEQFPNLGAWIKRMTETEFYQSTHVEYKKMLAEFAAKADQKKE